MKSIRNLLKNKYFHGIIVFAIAISIGIYLKNNKISGSSNSNIKVITKDSIYEPNNDSNKNIDSMLIALIKDSASHVRVILDSLYKPKKNRTDTVKKSSLKLKK